MSVQYYDFMSSTGRIGCPFVSSSERIDGLKKKKQEKNCCGEFHSCSSYALLYRTLTVVRMLLDKVGIKVVRTVLDFTPSDVRPRLADALKHVNDIQSLCELYEAPEILKHVNIE